MRSAISQAPHGEGGPRARIATRGLLQGNICVDFETLLLEFLTPEKGTRSEMSSSFSIAFSTSGLTQAVRRFPFRLGTRSLIETLAEGFVGLGLCFGVLDGFAT